MSCSAWFRQRRFSTAVRSVHSIYLAQSFLSLIQLLKCHFPDVEERRVVGASMAPLGRSACGVWPDTRMEGSGRGLAAREIAFRRRQNHEGNQELIGEACSGRTRWRSAGIRAHRRTDRGGSYRRHHVCGWQSARPLAKFEQLDVSLTCRWILISACITGRDGGNAAGVTSVLIFRANPNWVAR